MIFCIMTPLDIRELCMLGCLIALVALVSFTGMCINRYFIHRAHRRALDELHRRATLERMGRGEEENLSPSPVSLRK